MNYGKVAGYKTNTQKSVALLHTNNERSETEMKETLPFTTTLKRIKYLKINLPKNAKDLYSEGSTQKVSNYICSSQTGNLIYKSG